MLKVRIVDSYLFASVTRSRVKSIVLHEVGTICGIPEESITHSEIIFNFICETITLFRIELFPICSVSNKWKISDSLPPCKFTLRINKLFFEIYKSISICCYSRERTFTLYTILRSHSRIH